MATMGLNRISRHSEVVQALLAIMIHGQNNMLMVSKETRMHPRSHTDTLSSICELALFFGDDMKSSADIDRKRRYEGCTDRSLLAIQPAYKIVLDVTSIAGAHELW
jgi:hypothetical protein